MRYLLFTILFSISACTTHTQSPVSSQGPAVAAAPIKQIEIGYTVEPGEVTLKQCDLGNNGPCPFMCPVTDNPVLVGKLNGVSQAVFNNLIVDAGFRQTYKSKNVTFKYHSGPHQPGMARVTPQWKIFCDLNGQVSATLSYVMEVNGVSMNMGSCKATVELDDTPPVDPENLFNLLSGSNIVSEMTTGIYGGEFVRKLTYIADESKNVDEFADSGRNSVGAGEPLRGSPYAYPTNVAVNISGAGGLEIESVREEVRNVFHELLNRGISQSPGEVPPATVMLDMVLSKRSGGYNLRLNKAFMTLSLGDKVFYYTLPEMNMMLANGYPMGGRSASLEGLRKYVKVANKSLKQCWSDNRNRSMQQGARVVGMERIKVASVQKDQQTVKSDVKTDPVVSGREGVKVSQDVREDVEMEQVPSYSELVMLVVADERGEACAANRFRLLDHNGHGIPNASKIGKERRGRRFFEVDGADDLKGICRNPAKRIDAFNNKIFADTNCDQVREIPVNRDVCRLSFRTEEDRDLFVNFYGANVKLFHYGVIGIKK